jgi:hypothetical protein
VIGFTAELEKRLGKTLHVYQGSYSTNVAGSAGTHAGGGAVDFATYDTTSIQVMRECGGAAWHRTPAQGPWIEHAHVIVLGCTHVSPAAHDQQVDYQQGRNGLANHGPDDGPHVPYITWKDAVTIEGKDVSAYQPDFTPDPTDDFVIIKASEGTTYRNPDALAQVKRARVDGRVIGWYHYLHRGNIAAQVAYFVASTGIADGDLLVCDWEGTWIPTNAEKDAFIKAVKKLRPHSRVGLYCNVNNWKTVDTTNYCGDFLHIAYYSTKEPPIKTPWTIWQYSDGSGKLDHNRANFPTRAAMLTWAHGLVPKPIPKPPISTLTPYWLSLLLEARKKDMHAAVTVVTHAATTNTVEKALRKWGYTGNLVVDGHYGTSTDEAVKWFQAKVSPKVKPTGVFTEAQWTRFAGGPDGKALFTPELGNYQKWI